MKSELHFSIVSCVVKNRANIQKQRTNFSQLVNNKMDSEFDDGFSTFITIAIIMISVFISIVACVACCACYHRRNRQAIYSSNYIFLSAIDYMSNFFRIQLQLSFRHNRFNLLKEHLTTFLFRQM